MLPCGTPVEMTLALLPVGWAFKAGSRVRLAVASWDRDHVARCRTGARRAYLSTWHRAPITPGAARPLRLMRAQGNAMALLEITRVERNFYGVQALRGVDLAVKAGRLHPPGTALDRSAARMIAKPEEILR